MFEYNNNPFQKRLVVPPETKIIFVSDMFVEDYVGGAELTSEALIRTCPMQIHKLHAKDVTDDVIKNNIDKFWIFGNFVSLNSQLIPTIVANLKYSILEYDYKYCKARSPELHLNIEKVQCDCHDKMNGKIVSAFYYGATHLWWMSEKQKEKYVSLFPFLAERNNTVLSSVFDSPTLSLIKTLRDSVKNNIRNKWIVLGSSSWIKGFEDAKQWCIDNNKEYEIVWNVPYGELLKKLSQAQGLVYLPRGSDTCPRLVIEAKLLGCELVINDYVQHAGEQWFNDKLTHQHPPATVEQINTIEEYLYTGPKTFWEGIKHAMNYVPQISGYTTVYNAEKQQYPFVECIISMLAFCDEVCVVDGGSTDNTWENLKNLKVKLTADFGSHIAEKLVLKQVPRDWNNKYSAVFDGEQKAVARSLCTKEFCWQMDCDEIVHEEDIAKIKNLVKQMPPEADIVSLPVIEYWGGHEKVRVDVQPWKWRLSKNKKDITHGIPIDLRKFDVDGNMYAAPGTDGCDMISKSTGQRLPHVSFYNENVEYVRRIAITGNEQALKEYSSWFNTVTNNLPCVFHYSWYDLGRKIRLYRDYWTRHWQVLEGNEYVDTAETNMMFNVPWSQVTDSMIETKVNELKTIGGWIWHKKWNGEKTPWITTNRSQPASMRK